VIERAIVGSFGVIGESATRELATFQVIADAFAADSLAGARFVTAVACIQVLVLLALHTEPSFGCDCVTPKVSII